jgi:hypothetical protein
MEIMKQLQAPFDPLDIEWRVGSTSGDKSKGIALAYVTNRAIMNRLDELFGPFGWRNEFKEWKNNSQLCGISIKFENEWITKWDGADDSQTEAVKGGLSDAMKRAGYQWGIGRYLYNLENQWVPIKAQGKSYVLASEPRLPQWALPEGYSYGSGKPVEAPQTQGDTFAQESINEDLAAIERESQALYGAPAKQQTSTVTPIGNFVSEGQVKMLYAKLHQSEYKSLPKADVLEILSAHLAKNVTDFKFVEKTDINKVIKWLDEHKAA